MQKPEKLFHSRYKLITSIFLHVSNMHTDAWNSQLHDAMPKYFLKSRKYYGPCCMVNDFKKIYIVTRGLTARTTEPEKQSLLDNDGKHATIPEPSLSNVRTQQWRNCWKQCFLCSPRRGLIRGPRNGSQRNADSRRIFNNMLYVSYVHLTKGQTYT
jgi:hypothetical protein